MPPEERRRHEEEHDHRAQREHGRRERAGEIAVERERREAREARGDAGERRVAGGGGEPAELPRRERGREPDQDRKRAAAEPDGGADHRDRDDREEHAGREIRQGH
jgi:hypothetical protein